MDMSIKDLIYSILIWVLVFTCMTSFYLGLSSNYSSTAKVSPALTGMQTHVNETLYNVNSTVKTWETTVKNTTGTDIWGLISTAVNGVVNSFWGVTMTVINIPSYLSATITDVSGVMYVDPFIIGIILTMISTFVVWTLWNIIFKRND